MSKPPVTGPYITAKQIVEREEELRVRNKERLKDHNPFLPMQKFILDPLIERAMRFCIDKASRDVIIKMKEAKKGKEDESN